MGLYLKRLYEFRCASCGNGASFASRAEAEAHLAEKHPDDLTDEKLVVDKVRGVKVLRANKLLHLSPNIVEQGVSQGWLSMGQGLMTIHGEDGDVAYWLVRPPGYYCCHCDKTVDDGDSARVHLEEAHKGIASPDPNNPSGYRRDNFYCFVTDKAVDNMTADEARKLEGQVRRELHSRLGSKYRRTS